MKLTRPSLSHTIRASHFVLTLLLLSVPLRADVITVAKSSFPAPDFDEIQDAVDAAAEGDIVLVALGVYEGFEIAGKGITVVGDPGVLPVRVAGKILVRDVPPGSRVTLAQMQNLPDASETMGGLELRDCAGQVLVAELDVDAPPEQGLGSTALQVVNCDKVTLTRCGFAGGDDIAFFGATDTAGVGAIVQNSTVVFDGSPVSGGNGAESLAPEQAGSGRLGLHVIDSEVWVSGASLRGGNGDICNGGAGCDGSGASALRAEGSSLVRLRDVQLFPGEGGDDVLAAASEILGGATVQTSTSATSGLRLISGAVSRLDEDVDMTVSGPVGHEAYLLFSLGLGFAPVVGAEGVLHPTAPFVPNKLVPLGVLGDSGASLPTFSINGIGGLDGIEVFAQVITIAPGQSGRLGQTNVLVVVDSAF